MNPRLSIMSEKTKQTIINEISEIRGNSELFSRTVIENAVKSNPTNYPELQKLFSQPPIGRKDTFWITAFLNHSTEFEQWNSRYCKVPVYRYVGKLQGAKV